MKKILVLILFVSAQIVSAQGPQWTMKKDLKRGFRVDFPGTVNMQSQPIKTDIGEVIMDMYMLDNSADMSSDNLIYMVAYTAYPNDTDYSDEALQQSMLDSSINGAVTNVNGNLKSSNKIQFNGFNARDAFITIQSGMYTVHLRNILVENRLYLIQTISETTKSGNALEKKFFNSFELIKSK